MRTRFFLVSLSLICASASFLVACDSSTSDQAQAQDEFRPEKLELAGVVDYSYSGNPIPDILVTNHSQEALSLTSFDGLPVLINLWATWCGPCVVEMPMLDSLAAKLEGQLRVITVSQDMRGSEVVEPFFSDNDFKYLESWVDPQNKLSAYYDEAGILPLSILYDKEGQEVLRVSGGYHWNSNEGSALVAKALQ